MNKKTVELCVRGIGNSQSQIGAYILVLGEVGGSRHLPIIVGMYEAQSVAVAVRGIEPPRPMTHQLLVSVLQLLDVRLLRVLIHQEEEGVYQTWIYLQTKDNVWHVDARVSDAVVLALGMHAPILVYEDLLEERGIDDPVLKPAQQSAANTVDLLREQLQKAIDEEAYERAAELRDQIKLLTEGDDMASEFD